MSEHHSDEQRKKREKAVALRYDREKDEAPVVTAKGAGTVAERIIEMAREHRVPIQEDPSLVEILSKMELNEQIPEELYGVVAEVLAFVYRVDERVKEEMKRES